MFLSDPSESLLDMIVIKETSAGRITGQILVILFSAFIFGAFYFYQIRQGLAEIKGLTQVKKIRFRLFSIVFSIIFFSFFALSLVNVDFSRTEPISYIFSPYTIFTLIAVLTSGVVIVKDIKLYREVKQTKKRTEL